LVTFLHVGPKNRPPKVVPVNGGSRGNRASKKIDLLVGDKGTEEGEKQWVEKDQQKRGGGASDQGRKRQRSQLLALGTSVGPISYRV